MPTFTLSGGVWLQAKLRETVGEEQKKALEAADLTDVTQNTLIKAANDLAQKSVENRNGKASLEDLRSVYDNLRLDIQTCICKNVIRNLSYNFMSKLLNIFYTSHDRRWKITPENLVRGSSSNFSVFWDVGMLLKRIILFCKHLWGKQTAHLQQNIAAYTGKLAHL